MRFTVSAKELKTMIEKCVTVVNKGAYNPELKRIYFEVTQDGILKATATDVDQFVEIETDNITDLNVGAVGIDVEDINVVTKMTGLVSLEKTEKKGCLKINIKSGKKILTIPGYENESVQCPSLDDTEMDVLNVTEKWLLETLVSLDPFTTCQAGNNKTFEYFNFNLKEKRVEVVDGVRIATRKLKDEMFLLSQDEEIESVLLYKNCVPVMKKVLNKKSDNKATISQDKKYIKIRGGDFLYISRKADLKFFDTNNLLKNISEKFSFLVSRESFLQTIKYDIDLLKTNKRKEQESPLVLTSENGQMYSYINTG